MSARPILKFDEASYKILVREGCRLVHGHMPLNEFLHLLKQASDSALLHVDTARMLGATAVIGSPQALARLRKQEAPAVMERVRAQLGLCARRLDADAIRWLAFGEQGASGLALFTLLTGIRPRHSRGTALNPPKDAGDVRRCRLMIEQVASLRRALPVLAQRVTEPDVAPWAALAEEWGDLCALLDPESPGWRRGRCRAPGVDALLACLRDAERVSA
jgi:hypothetical protein